MSKYLIVFGANGMLGRYICSYFGKLDEFHIIKITREILNIETTNYETILSVLKPYSQSLVINCCGKIPQRKDSNTKSYLQVNTLFPHLLSQCCKETENKLIHITTDCVFTGMRKRSDPHKGNYSENDPHDENNIYGLSKSLGEPNNCTIIRTSIIGEELNNKLSLLEWIKSNKNSTIEGYTNHYWNGVTCLELCKIIHHIINSNGLWLGVRHIFSPDIVTKYDLIKMISKTYNLNIKIIPIEKNFVDKSLSSIHESLTVPSIQHQLTELKNYYLI